MPPNVIGLTCEREYQLRQAMHWNSVLFRRMLRARHASQLQLSS